MSDFANQEGGAPHIFDRAGHLRKDLAALERELGRDDALLLPVWRDLNLIDGRKLTRIEFAAARELLAGDGELVFLGKLGATSCFAIDISMHPDPSTLNALRARGEFLDLRRSGPTLPPDDVALASYARAILHWHRRTQHCGACGSPTAPRDGGHVRVCRADGCRTESFPRTDPAVIMLVHSGDRCLLGRQANWPRGMYSALAGFVEPGETLEQAVVREVHEETSVHVDDVRYFRSQPWPFPASLMVGFTAAARSEAIAPSEELEDARWFTRAELRDLPAGLFVPPPFSLSGQLIAAFLQEGER